MNEYDYRDFKGQWFVWIGHRATTGEPNPRTGRLSKYGHYYCAESRAQAKNFVADYGDWDPAKVAVVGTARTLRQYARGLAVQTYLEHLTLIPSLKQAFTEWSPK